MKMLLELSDMSWLWLGRRPLLISGLPFFRYSLLRMRRILVQCLKEDVAEHVWPTLGFMAAATMR